MTTHARCLHLLMVAAALTAVPAAHAAPDEDDLGKSAGYPYQKLTPDFSQLTDKYKIGNFTHMDDIFWPRPIAAPAQPRALTPRAEPFTLRYEFNGRSFTLDDFLARQRVMGLLVLKGDEIVHESYQYGTGPQSRFASFSMAKTMVALLVGIAQQEGRIASLDDPAARHAPALKGSAYENVTVRQLLRMSSGARWSDKVLAGQPTDIAQLSADSYYRRGRGGADTVRNVRESAHAPGTVFNYASADTQALAMVLQGAVGSDVSSYAAQRLWQPLGAEAPASWLTDSAGLEAAFCCMNARLRDYGRLGLLLAGDGSVAGRAVVPREFLLDATDAQRQPDYLKPRRATQFFGYGYQTWLYPYRTRTFQARGLFGQEIIVQPSSGIVIVMVSALKTPDVPNDIFVERNYFTGAILKALGGQADIYR